MIHILIASGKLSKPISRVYEICQPLQAFGYKLPEIDLNEWGSFQTAQEASSLLSKDLNARAPWLETGFSMIHILAASGKLNKSIYSIYEICQTLKPFGYTFPAIDLEKWGSFQTTRETLLLLSKYRNSRAPWLETGFTKEHLLNASKRLKLPLPRIYEICRPLQAFGYTLPDIDPEAEG
ncbi:MAG: hypothetical protein QNK37_33470 [Acidobacteriota bacterium]|nr:hypothetical protein [Acidobacteriota bacterium]